MASGASLTSVAAKRSKSNGACPVIGTLLFPKEFTTKAQWTQRRRTHAETQSRRESVDLRLLGAAARYLTGAAEPRPAELRRTVHPAFARLLCVSASLREPFSSIEPN